MPVAGSSSPATLGTFASAAVANAVVVRIYERGRLSDLGLGWSATSNREFFPGSGHGRYRCRRHARLPILGGEATFQRTAGVEHPWASFASSASCSCCGAVGEEMLFHRLRLQLLIPKRRRVRDHPSRRRRFRAGAHGQSERQPPGILNTMMWGVLLGYAYVRSGALWLPSECISAGTSFCPCSVRISAGYNGCDRVS